MTLPAFPLSILGQTGVRVPVLACVRGVAATLVLLGACPGTRAQTLTQETGSLSPVLVTATARAETSTRITSTTQVLERAVIERSTASSITDFMGENAVGFLNRFCMPHMSLLQNPRIVMNFSLLRKQKSSADARH